MESKCKKEFIINVLYAVIMLFLALLGSFVVFKYLLPFVIGTVIAFAVQKPSRYLEGKTHFKKSFIAIFLSLLVYVAIFALLVFLAYGVIKFSLIFAEKLPEIFGGLAGVFDAIEQKYSNAFLLLPKEFSSGFSKLMDNTLSLFIEKIGGKVSGFAGSVAKVLPSFFISSIVTLVATCYIAKDYDSLLKFFKSFLGRKTSEKIVKIKNIFVGSVLKIVKGYAILLLITFLELYVGFLIIGLEFSFVLAILISLVDLLPVIGTGTVMIPWAVISALLGKVRLAVCLAILYVVILLLRNFLEPKIIANQIGINSLFTLGFMFLGLKVLGFWGLVLFPIIFIVTIKYYKSEM